MNWSEFFAMGGYGFYVWSSYALAALILVINVLVPLWQRRTAIKHIRRQIEIDKRGDN